MGRRNSRITSPTWTTSHPPEPPPFQSPPPKSSLPRFPSPHINPPPRTQNTFSSFRISKLFEILEIDPTYSKRKARVAFMLLARKYHPEKWDINTSEFSFETIVEKIKSLSNAYDELKESNFLYWRLVKTKIKYPLTCKR